MEPERVEPPDSATWSIPTIEELHGHTGDCTYPCPLCAGFQMLRHVRPDVASHVAAAAKEMMLALRALLDAVTDPQPADGEGRVDRISFD